MARAFIAILAFVSLAAADCVPPDCDHADHGTCVQACCKLSFKVAGQNTTEVGAKITALFKAGGPDGRYTLWGTVPNQGPLLQVVQGTHLTEKRLYTDSLDFGVTAAGADSVVLAFSHSQDFIKGDFAYGDNGQNYKNLVGFMKGAYHDIAAPEILFGCPAPKPSAGCADKTTYCCPDAKHCLAPGAAPTPCADGKCADGKTCCPLTKLCVTVNEACTPICPSDSYCCPDALHCLAPTNPGVLCSKDAPCKSDETCCPLTHECVSVGAPCNP